METKNIVVNGITWELPADIYDDIMGMIAECGEKVPEPLPEPLTLPSPSPYGHTATPLPEGGDKP